MGFMEIAARGMQEASKWLERAGIAGRSSWDANVRFGDSKVNAPTRVPDTARFFEGAVSAATPGLLFARAPASCTRAIAEAEDILRGRFALLGHRDLHFGDPIDWHLDPLSGRRAPFVHWSKLDTLDPTNGGDCKLVWELNRHQWFVRLGQAYRLTGDERYATHFAARLRHWMEVNPPGFGINWASSLEVGLRLIAWCWAMHLFIGSRALDAQLTSLMAGAIATHAAHVERNLSYYFSANTHLTGEALSLFHAGILLQDTRSAPRWRALGSRILSEQIERQVFSDGVYFEQSTCYQRYTLDTYLHFIALSERSHHAIGQQIRDRVGLMLDCLIALRAPDGTMPEIGDADGGRLVPLDNVAPDDFSAVFSTAAALLGREDCAWAAGGLSDETLWLLGARGLAAFDSLTAAPPGDSPSRLFPHGGMVVMADGRSEGANRMLFDVGPLGCHLSGGHGHSDLLSITCSAFGRACLVDPGTFCYTSDSPWRNHFRASFAHSTVTVDGETQARPKGPFSWRERPSARLLQWSSTVDFDFADAEHDAYARFSDAVIHRRRVLFVKPRFWVIVDDLYGTVEHTVEMRYQFAPGYQVSLERTPWVAAHGPAGASLFAAVFCTVPSRAYLREGSLDPIGGWVSPGFGTRLAAPALCYRADGRFPIRMATMLFPTDRITATPPHVAPLMSSGPALRGLAINHGEEFVLIDDHSVSLEKR
jgi:hypothetical protein